MRIPNKMNETPQTKRYRILQLWIEEMSEIEGQLRGLVLRCAALNARHAHLEKMIDRF